MILTTDVAQRFYEVLAADQALNDWSQAAYGKLPRLRLGVNPRNLPRLEQDAPFVAIRPVSSQGGATDEFRHVLDVILGLADQRAELAELAGRGLVLPALRVIEADFARLVLGALAGASPNLDLSEVAGEFDATQYPLVLYGLRITCLVPNVIGATINL